MGIPEKTTIYTFDRGKAPKRLEFSSKGTEKLDSHEGKSEVALALFQRLKTKGLIPQEARFEGQVKGSQPPISYKEALLETLNETKTDVDVDGLYDLDLAVFTKSLINKGVLKPERGKGEDLATALVSADSNQQLRNETALINWFCDERHQRSLMSNPTPSAGTTGSAAANQTGSSPVLINENGIEARFVGNPFDLADATAYFRKFSKTHTPAELRQELEQYLTTYFVHASRTSLAEANVSEFLKINSHSDLTKYFASFQGKLVIDCNVFAEISNAILTGAGIEGLTTQFVSVDFFGAKTGHTVLLVSLDGQNWLVNNNDVSILADNSDAKLATVLSSDKYPVAKVDRSKSMSGTLTGKLANDPVRALASHHPSIRLNAIEYLKWHPDPKATAALVQLIETDKDPAVQLNAVFALRCQLTDGKKPNLAPLKAVWEKISTPLVKAELLDVLFRSGQIDQPTYVANLGLALDEAAKQPNSYIHFTGRSDVGIWAHEEIIGLLLEQGQAGGEALASRLGTYPKDFQETIFRKIECQHPANQAALEVLEKGLEVNFRDAYYCLKEIASRADNPAAIKLLSGLIDSPHQEEAFEALTRLAQNGNQTAAMALVSLLDHQDQGVRFLAFHSLAAVDGSTIKHANGWVEKRASLAKILTPQEKELLAAKVINFVKGHLGKNGLNVNGLNVNASIGYYLDYDPLGMAITLLAGCGGATAESFLLSLQKTFNALDAAEKDPKLPKPKQIEIAGQKIQLKSFPFTSIGSYCYRINNEVATHIAKPGTAPTKSFASIR